MNAVLGEGPLAEALAISLGPAVLVGAEALPGAYLWRRADLESGEGVLAALEGCERAWMVLHRPRQAHGAFAVLTRRSLPVTVASPVGHAPSALERLPQWPHVAVPPVWGGRHPLVRRWSDLAKKGAHLWIPRLGLRQVGGVSEAVAALRQVADEPGARWTLGSHPASHSELARAICAHHRRPLRATRAPLAMAKRLGRLPEEWLETWFSHPGPVPFEGCEPSGASGPAAWLEGL